MYCSEGSHSGTLMYGSEGSHSGTLMYCSEVSHSCIAVIETFRHAKVLSGLHLELEPFWHANVLQHVAVIEPFWHANVLQ